MQTWIIKAIKRNAHVNTAAALAFCTAADVEWMPRQDAKRKRKSDPSRDDVRSCMRQRHGTRGQLY